MPTTCSLPANITGPFNQTLFLGCSIIDFNANLGWGADSSTLTVNLIEDTSMHPSSTKYQQDFINALKTIETNNITTINTANASRTSPAPSEFGKINSSTATTKVYDYDDPNKNAHVPILKNVIKEENERTALNDIRTDPDTIKDLGKVCYDNITATKKYWVDRDPGFLGSSSGAFAFNQIVPESRRTPVNSGMDLVGVPAYFKYGDNFSFGGIITSWRENTSKEGIKYSVEMKNFSSLLSNCQLIIGHYAGSIFNKINNTNNNSTRQNIGIPGPTGDADGYKGTIAQGNTPNVFNIYGWLESFGFGNAQENENGIPAYKIYDALQTVLNPARSGAGSASQDLLISSYFSPYGGILSKTIATRDSAGYTIPLTSNTTLNSSAGDSTKLSLEDMGILPTVPGIDNIKRCVFRLDISEVPRPPSWLRIKGPNISIMQFITDLCEGSGFDFFIHFEPNTFSSSINIDNRRKFSGTIKVKTVSRRLQPPKGSVAQLLNNFITQGVPITNRSYGQEFNDNITRTMYIGAKQQRLIQYKTNRFNWNQHSLVYDPYANNGAGSFLNVPVNQILNYVRFPLATSYRSQNLVSGGAVCIDPQNLPITNLNANFETAGPTLNFVNQQVNEVFGSLSDPQYNNIRKGNYDTQSEFNEQYEAANSIPIYNDVICPYFGKHFDGSIRRVYYDKQMGQMQILFKIQDLFIAGNTLSFAEELTFNIKHFVVLENEIRAAGAGFEQWLSYCFDNGFYTDIERLVYRALYRKYGNAANVDIGSIHRNFIDSLRNGSFNNVGLNQFGYSNMVAFGNDLYSSLQNIHKVFNNVANEFYGKTYMVSLPRIKTYRDLNVTEIVVGYAFKNDGSGQLDPTKPIYAIEGSNKLYQDYEISTDGAWEEPGNMIDDSIVIGSTESSFLTNDNNMIQPIVGFNTSTTIDGRYLRMLSTAATAVTSQPLLYNALRGLISANAANQTERAVYKLLTSDIDPAEYVSVRRPPRSTPANNANAHGYATQYSEKTYIKSSVNEKVEFLSFDNNVYPKAIISMPSPVVLSSQHKNMNNLKSAMVHDTLIRMLEAFGRGPIGLPDVVGGGVNPAIRATLYSLANFSDATTRNHYRSETNLGGLLPKINFTTLINIANLNLIKSIVGAIEVAYIRSLGTDLGQAYPIGSMTTADGYDNPQILPKAAFPIFAAIPVKLNQYVYGPWVNYPSLIAKNIFTEHSNNNTVAISRVENLIGGLKLEIDDTLNPWSFGGMSVLDQNILLKLNQDVNYQQEIESASLEIGIFPDFPLGYALINNGPILNHIGVQIQPNGITTTLNFRTYIRKLGLFNKENAERIKAISLESIKRNKEITTKYNDLRDRIQNANPGSSTSLTDFANQTIPKVLRWSPVEILVGGNTITQTKKTSITDYQQNLNYTPSWGMKPYSKIGSFNAVSGVTVKQVSRVTLQDFREAPLEFQSYYGHKSMMSLDGILSPVSLFPTPYGTTYHFTKYDSRACPICKGNKYYSFDSIKGTITTQNPGRGINIFDQETQSLPVYCDFCETKDPNAQFRTSFGGVEKDPPSILWSGSDANMLSQLTGNLSALVGSQIINYSTLNPIVLTNGEFANLNKQSGDASAHCIDSIAYGVLPPSKYNEGIRSIINDDPSEAFSNIDTKWTTASNSNNPLSNNHRFFALRGPLTMHSWGYDTEGYPVPNMADEPLVDAQGNLIRDSGNNNSIVVKGQRLVNGKWSKQIYRERTFYKGWAQLPGTWPVGPIDLRWDRDAKVWTVGTNNYKPVFVIMEEDLTDSQPVRGSLLENKINNEPLPSGLRRLVFVKDNKGITAPRGSKIYCRYSPNNGFYEPIFGGNVTTSGIILGNSTARIYQAYIIPTGSRPSDINNPQYYDTSFQNPLGFRVVTNTAGIFTFINGSWILQNSNAGC
jgi:hypothetical protein